MSNLPLVTATAECIAALRVLGFRIEGSDRSHVMLRALTGRRVLVPRRETLDSNQLTNVLLFAQVDPAVYLRAVGHIESGEFSRIESSSGVRSRKPIASSPPSASEAPEGEAPTPDKRHGSRR